MSVFFKGLFIVNKDNITEFNCSGVWALFGKRKDAEDNKWYCLQVAETSCIKSEIAKDMELIDSELNEFDNEISYINQFGEVLFWYHVYPSHREYLYSKYIKEQFKDFQFYVVCKEENRATRRSIEKEFAYRTNAVYWRNGKPFKNGEKIDFENRKYVAEGIPNNDDVSKSIIIPFAEKYNNQ